MSSFYFTILFRYMVSVKMSKTTKKMHLLLQILKTYFFSISTSFTFVPSKVVRRSICLVT